MRQRTLQKLIEPEKNPKLGTIAKLKTKCFALGWLSATAGCYLHEILNRDVRTFPPPKACAGLRSRAPYPCGRLRLTAVGAAS